MNSLNDAPALHNFDVILHVPQQAAMKLLLLLQMQQADSTADMSTHLFETARSFGHDSV